MDPLATKLILDEICKLIDKFDARFAKQDAALETSGAVSVSTQAASVEADAVADNWVGFFDGGDDPIEQHRAAPPIVADNLAGLFEQPAHDPEEHDLVLSAIDDFGSAQIRNENGLTFSVPDALSHGDQGSSTGPTIVDPAALEELASPPLDDIARVFRAPASESLGPVMLGAVGDTKQERHAAIVRAEGLGTSCRVFIGMNIQRFYHDFAPADPDLLHCVRLDPVERALRATPLDGYDGSLDDDPESGFAHLDAPLDRAVGRVGQALEAAATLRADAVGAAGGGCGVSAGHLFDDLPACERSFADVPVGAFWEEMLRWNNDSGTILAAALAHLKKVALAHHGEASAPPSSSDLLADASRTRASKTAGGTTHTMFLRGGMTGITMSRFMSREHAYGSAHKVIVHHHGPVATGDVLRPEQKVPTPVVLKHARLEFGEMPNTYTTTIHSAVTILDIDDEKETVQMAVSELQLALKEDLKATEVDAGVVRTDYPTFRLLTEAEAIGHLKAINLGKAST